MKTCVLLIAFCLTCIIGNAQVVAIQVDKENKVYLCVDNPLTVAVEGLSSRDISLSTDNGEIKKDEYSIGHYNYHPKYPGIGMIYVKKNILKGGNKIIDSMRLRVHRMPLPQPKFAGRSSGSMSKAQILVQAGITAPIENFDINGQYRVHSYTVLVYRDKTEIFRKQILGPLFDKTVSDFLYSLQNEDELKFTEIKITDCDGELRLTDPISITVKDATEYRKVKQTDTLMIEDPMTGEMMLKLPDSVWRRVKED
jgi:hypothetical protein